MASNVCILEQFTLSKCDRAIDNTMLRQSNAGQNRALRNWEKLHIDFDNKDVYFT